MEDSSSKTVFVCCREHKREVKFSAATNEKMQLEEAVFSVFDDIIERGCLLLLQVKREGWAGEYVDLGEDSIPNGSIIKAVLMEQVIIMHFYLRLRISLLNEPMSYFVQES